MPVEGGFADFQKLHNVVHAVRAHALFDEQRQQARQVFAAHLGIEVAFFFERAAAHYCLTCSPSLSARR